MSNTTRNLAAFFTDHKMEIYEFNQERDKNILHGWLKLAGNAGSIEEFCRKAIK